MIADGQQLGQLNIVRFSDNGRLIPAGTTLFAAPNDMPPEIADVSLQQGAREQSNVNAVDELVRMITGMRHHEAAQRAMRLITQALEQQANG